MAAPTEEQVKELFRIHEQFAEPERKRRALAFDDTRSWVDENGYRLSDRVWQCRQSVRKQIDQVLQHAIATGEDALQTAKVLEQYLAPGERNAVKTYWPGRGGMGSYPARRLARTEVTRAHGQATLLAAAANPFVRGVRWNLSQRHPEPDECDDHASANVAGLGVGVYPPDRVPRYPSHPQDLCFLTPETVEDETAVVDELRRRYGLDEGAPPAPSATATVKPPAAAPPPAMPTPPAPPPRPPVAPVADAFSLPPAPTGLKADTMRIRGDVDVRAVAEDNLATIGQVHQDGALPRIPVREDFSQFSPVAGRFRFSPATGTPVDIQLNAERTWADSSANTFVHEVGHFLDFSGMGKAGTFASEADPLLEGWRTAVRSRRAVQTLETQRVEGIGRVRLPDGTMGEYQVDQRYVSYLLDPSEVWARSYMQYVTTRSGDRTLRRQLAAERLWDDLVHGFANHLFLA